MSTPFYIDGPAMISFSGGRTSGMLLHRIMEAHGGTLPMNVHVVFANTGKEFPSTLDFVRVCADQWKAPIIWVEYDGAGPEERDARAQVPVDPQRFPGRTADRSYRTVDYNTASRRGEPFARLIHQDRYLPNPHRRTCTQHLKIEAMDALMRAMGYATWTSAIGFRADEERRIAKARDNAVDYAIKVFPLATAGIQKADVMAFWKSQRFDLGLRWWESNCDQCFLKGQRIRTRIAVDHPRSTAWWIEQERHIGGRFTKGRTYTALAANARNQLHLPMLLDPPEDEGLQDCACTD